MKSSLHTVINLVLSLIGLGFIAWLFVRSYLRSTEPLKLVAKWLSTVAVICVGVTVAAPAYARGGSAAIVGLALTLVLGIVVNVIWRNSLIDLFAKPITSIFDGGSEEPEQKPAYSVALANRRKNRPLEAVVAIREQLAKFPKDFEGVMLLANIQAEDLNDLPGAEITLNHFCNLAGAPDRQVVSALTQLADWHMKKAADVDSARAALQQIVERFPGTEPALRAEQRIAHLGEAEKIILARYDNQNIVVPEGVNNIGLLDSTAFLQPKEIEPGKLAAVYVKQLEQHPHDAEAREKLATIYARDFHRLDLATMELAQMIGESRYGPKRVAAWLNLLASFQIELGAAQADVRETLERIVEDFPDSPAAEQAQRRLARLDAKFKAQNETPSVKLGVYEQNIGLKYGSPRKL